MKEIWTKKEDLCPIIKKILNQYLPKLKYI